MGSHATTFGQAHPRDINRMDKTTISLESTCANKWQHDDSVAQGPAWGNMVQKRFHSIGDWRHKMASIGATEDLVPYLKGVKKIRRLLAKVIDRVQVGDVGV